MVKVRFYGALLQTTGGEKQTEATANTIGDLVRVLSAKYGDDFRNRVLEDDSKLASYLRIFVNDKDIRFLGLMDAPLAEGDSVIFMPAIGGG